MKKLTVTLLIIFIFCSTLIVGCSSEEKSQSADEKTTESSIPTYPTKTVSFSLPIDYFSVEEDQKESTQEQLDEHSKDGLKYEFSSDGETITCIVTDQALALKTAAAEMENYFFEECQNPEDPGYVKSYQEMDYNKDCSEITVTCNSSDWSEYDGWNSLIFLNYAHRYQQIMGYSRNEVNSSITFIDENENILFSDDLKNYLD